MSDPENPIRVTIWNEFRHEKTDKSVQAVYPDGIHIALQEMLDGHGYTTRTATLDEPEHGLSEDVLNETDVLTWWGHLAHHEVSDEIVDKIQRRVLDGMGLIVLHSGHVSKIFMRLMGTGCMLKWREAEERERLWVIAPGHPIAAGIDEFIELEAEEMYGEHFDIPEPDTVVFVSWFQGGEVFRSGCCFTRGLGRVFYFQPGHETHPTYHNPQIQLVIANAVQWAAPERRAEPIRGNTKPLEAL